MPDIQYSIIEKAIDTEISEGNLTPDLIEGESCVFLSSLFRAEQGTAKHIQRLLKGDLPWPPIELNKAIPWVEAKTDLKLSAQFIGKPHKKFFDIMALTYCPPRR